MRRPPTQHILESEIGCTIHTDGSNIGRKKISNTMMTTPIRGKDGKVFSKNILLNLTEECIGGSEQHFQAFPKLFARDQEVGMTYCQGCQG